MFCFCLVTFFYILHIFIYFLYLSHACSCLTVKPIQTHRQYLQQLKAILLKLMSVDECHGTMTHTEIVLPITTHIQLNYTTAFTYGRRHNTGQIVFSIRKMFIDVFTKSQKDDTDCSKKMFPAFAKCYRAIKLFRAWPFYYEWMLSYLCKLNDLLLNRT